MRVRTKHAEKTCVGLWSQSTIQKTVCLKLQGWGWAP